MNLKDILNEWEVNPSRALGQNFLTDPSVASRIVECLEPAQEDCVVEVGPGTGALTEHIAPLVRKLILVEFDARLAAFQRERWADHPHVEVHHADGATWDPRGLFAEGSVKFLGNLPYSAGGAILQNFLSRPSPITRAVVMLQKEFIDRIIATPADDAYGLLSVRIQRNWIPRVLLTVPPEAFHPRPKIESTVMELLPRPASEFPPYDQARMDELMRRAFSQRRKQLKRHLPEGAVYPVWTTVAEQIGCSPLARPEELSLRQWIDLSNAYDSRPRIAQSETELFDVVDGANCITGQATRQEIHANGWNHRAAHVLVVNKRGHVLLQKRSVWKDRQPNKWDCSAAGHLDAGEDYHTAAARELQEELGIHPDDAPLKHVADFPASAENGHEFMALFATQFSSKIHFNPAEIDSVQWFTPEQIDTWVAARPQDFSPAFPSAWVHTRV